MPLELKECPECGHEVEFYDTASDGKSGRYRCSNPKCGRDTIWMEARVYSFEEVVTQIKERIRLMG